MQIFRSLFARLFPSLFLSRSARIERARLKHLERLKRQHQGRPFLFDDGNLRFMYFNESTVQSAMKLDAPDELLCGYTRAMMAFLLANPAPRQLLMIGLGGGSQLKFCARHLPDCRVTVLEIDADVIAMREQFMLPADGANVEIIHCDAVTYLTGKTMQFDVILLDGFDKIGLVAELNNARFYARCHAALKPGGILVANLWGQHSLVASLLSDLLTQFDASSWWCRALDSYNLLVFSFKGRPAGFTPEMLATAPELDRRMALQLSLLSLRNPRQLGNRTAAGRLIALNTEVIELMKPDIALPRTHIEWSAPHQ
jgi:spermidine synthase